MERVDGISLGDPSVSQHLPQSTRDEIAGRVVELCLKELFVWKEMQTDPNWSNFLWNGGTGEVGGLFCGLCFVLFCLGCVVCVVCVVGLLDLFILFYFSPATSFHFH